MAIMIPWWLGPILDFYGLRWPDIDEGAVVELGSSFDNVCENAVEFGQAITAMLESLSENSRSDAYDALVESWSQFANQDLLNTVNAAGDGAENACNLIAAGIGGYKTGLLTTLVLNVGSDIALIATGVGVPAAVAKKAVMRVVLEQAITFVTQQAASELVSLCNDQFDHLVVEPIEALAKELRSKIVDAAADVVTTDVSVRAFTSSTAGALYIDHHEVIDAAVRMKTAYDGLHGAVVSFSHWSKGTGFIAPPIGTPDPTVRTLLKEALDWAVDAFVNILQSIGQEIVNNLIELVTKTYEKYVEADTSLGLLASELREQYKFPTPLAPYVVDRSTRPTPIALPPTPEIVRTGVATSDARFDITLIDLPDIAEPVVTGAGTSDARFDIKLIDLSDIAEPVVTGAGTSDARFDISVIDLPDIAEPVVTGAGTSDARFDISTLVLEDHSDPDN